MDGSAARRPLSPPRGHPGPDARAAPVGLAYDGLRVAVTADDPGALPWLEEFLGPSFAPAPAGAAPCRVALLADAERYRRLLALGPAAATEALDAFTLDQRVLRFPRWAAPAVTVHDPASAVFHVVEAEEGRFTILAEPGNLGARIALMRVVRELATAHALGRGGLLLHAAAVAVDGRVVVLAGPAGAGKTTLLLHLLGTGRTTYVANDRVRVAGLDTAPRARGMPTIVTLRPPTRALFPALMRRLEAGGCHYRRGRAERTGPPSPPLRPWPDGRLGLSPAHLADALGVAREAEGEVAAVLFPTITGEAGGLTLHELAEPEAAARLERSLLGAGHWPRHSTIFAPRDGPPPPGEAELRARARRLARAVRCFECRLGSEAYAEAVSASPVLALASPRPPPG